jgi:acyl-CoA dehydrogenase
MTGSAIEIVGLGAAPPDDGYTSLTERADRVALIAAEFASEVDRDARFPEEAFGAAQAQRLMGVLVPTELGGEGAQLRDITAICYRLGRACASTAMIFAMHQCCVACLVRHGQDSEWHRGLLRRIVSDQLLLASSTTEGQSGGNLRSSSSPIEEVGAAIRLDRAATVVSYGARADGIVTTARRSPDAAANDQVLVALCRSDYTLTPLSSWDALGMRGTCSAGFALRATGQPAQVLPEPYESIHAQTMVPIHHLVWASVWAGIAAGATERARAFVRQAARSSNGAMPPGAARLTLAHASLTKLRGLIASSLRAFETRVESPRALRSFEFQVTINLTKVEASELALETVMHAVRACGLSGYRNDSEFSLGRALRDILSAPIMINNDRILGNIASATLMSALPAGLDD